MAGRKLTDEQIKELTPDEARGLFNQPDRKAALRIYELTGKGGKVPPKGAEAEREAIARAKESIIAEQARKDKNAARAAQMREKRAEKKRLEQLAKEQEEEEKEKAKGDELLSAEGTMVAGGFGLVFSAFKEQQEAFRETTGKTNKALNNILEDQGKTNKALNNILQRQDTHETRIEDHETRLGEAETSVGQLKDDSEKQSGINQELIKGYGKLVKSARKMKHDFARFTGKEASPDGFQDFVPASPPAAHPGLGFVTPAPQAGPPSTPFHFMSQSPLLANNSPLAPGKGSTALVGTGHPKTQKKPSVTSLKNDENTAELGMAVKVKEGALAFNEFDEEQAPATVAKGNNTMKRVSQVTSSQPAMKPSPSAALKSIHDPANKPNLSQPTKKFSPKKPLARPFSPSSNKLPGHSFKDNEVENKNIASDSNAPDDALSLDASSPAFRVRTDPPSTQEKPLALKEDETTENHQTGAKLDDNDSDGDDDDADAAVFIIGEGIIGEDDDDDSMISHSTGELNEMFQEEVDDEEEEEEVDEIENHGVDDLVNAMESLVV